MKLLTVSNYQPPHMGGIEFAVDSLKRCWEHDGHDVTWLTTDLPRSGQPATTDNIRIPAWNFLEERFQINTPIVSPARWFQFRELVRSHDAINTHSLAPGPALAVMLEALRQRKPVVATQHVGVISLGSSVLSRLQEQVLTRMARKVTQQGGILTFVGQAVRDWFLEHAGIDASRVHMTPAGIDQHTYHFVNETERTDFRQTWNLNQNTLNVLFVGRFYEKKGLPVIRKVAERMPDMRFTLVGGGALDPAAWQLPNVHVIPFVSNADLRELYGCHDVFLMPSHGEGWPAVIPQAMICGLPCMISEDCFEGYNRDRDRFYVARRDASSVAEMLKGLRIEQLRSPEWRRNLSEYAAATWDWQRTARIYIDLLESLR